jgi:hypothetical protein
LHCFLDPQETPIYYYHPESKVAWGVITPHMVTSPYKY